VQGYLLKHKSDPHAAVAGAAVWVQEVREEREKRKVERAKRIQRARVKRIRPKDRNEDKVSDKKPCSI
jgi:hypothetical protein